MGWDQTGLDDEGLIEHWDGSSWTVNVRLHIGDAALLGVDSLSPTDAWAVGFHDTVAPLVEHWNGAGWFVSSTPVPGPYGHLFAVSAVSASDIWAVGHYNHGDLPNLNLAFHYDGTDWRQITVPSPGKLTNQLSGVSAISADDVWAVGAAVDENNVATPVTFHWDGVRWSQVATPSVTGSVLTAVTSVATDDVWAVGWGSGPPLSIHWDGTSWTQVLFPDVAAQVLLKGVDASSSTEVWAVGEASRNSEDWGGVAFLWNGTRWRLSRPIQTRPPTHFFGVRVLGEKEAWAVGYWESNIDSTLTERLADC